MAVYFCKRCGMNVEENSTPHPNGCSCSSNGHGWVKVSGNTSFYCRKCHMTVVCDTAPHTALGGGCPASGSHTHAWVKR